MALSMELANRCSKVKSARTNQPGCLKTFAVMDLLSRSRIRNASGLTSICSGRASQALSLRTHTQIAMLKVTMVFVKPCIQSLDRSKYSGKGIEIYYTFIQARKQER